jgi:hypothetical protein
MGARKLSKRGQAAEQFPQGFSSGDVPTVPQPGQQVTRDGGMPAGPMVQQDSANAQTANTRSEVDRLRNRFSWQARQNAGPAQ